MSGHRHSVRVSGYHGKEVAGARLSLVVIHAVHQTHAALSVNAIHITILIQGDF